MDKPTSTNPDDYEILIRRRGENDYAAYCPQLNYMIKANVHEEVADSMKEYIHNFIKELLSKQ
jgi:hypothetical protein